MNILITSAEWKAALSCMRSLARKEHTISLMSADRYVPVLYSKFCSEKIISPNENDKDAYLKFLLRLLQDKKYDLLIPISDSCIEYFSEIREEILKYTRILLAPKESVTIAGNKDRTYRFAYENNIPIPRTYFPQNISEVEKISDLIDFPCVVKKSQGAAGQGNTYINGKKNLISLFNGLKNINNWPVIQEFIKGKCYGFIAMCDSGKLLGFFMHEKLRQYPQTGGVTVYGRSVYDKRIHELSVLLVEKLKWSGPISFDYFITKNEKCLLLEINPRFSAITQFAYACGVDLPHQYLARILQTGNNFPQRRYRTGRYYRTVFLEEIRSCLENKKYIPSFFFNYLRPNFVYDFSVFDHKLLFWQLRWAKWYLARNL